MFANVWDGLGNLLAALAEGIVGGKQSRPVVAVLIGEFAPLRADDLAEARSLLEQGVAKVVIQPLGITAGADACNRVEIARAAVEEFCVLEPCLAGRIEVAALAADWRASKAEASQQNPGARIRLERRPASRSTAGQLPTSVRTLLDFLSTPDANFSIAVNSKVYRNVDGLLVANRL